MMLRTAVNRRCPRVARIARITFRRYQKKPPTNDGDWGGMSPPTTRGGIGAIATLAVVGFRFATEVGWRAIPGLVILVAGLACVVWAFFTQNLFWELRGWSC